MIDCAIEKYYMQFNEKDYYFKNTEYSHVSTDIIKLFENGRIPVRRNSRTDISCFKKEFGVDLPEEIELYINEYWHTHIYGYYNSEECIILFAVLKKEGDTDNDILFYKNSLIELARKWQRIGDISKFIPIGWLGYSGGNVLYEVSTSNIYLEDVNSNIEGEINKKPIASSLEELIKNLIAR